MQIQVKLGEPLWRAVGSRRLALEWAAANCVSLEEVMARLAADYPGFADAYAGKDVRKAYPYQLFIDAARVWSPPAGSSLTAETPESTQRCLADGQTLFILLPAVGGQ